MKEKKEREKIIIDVYMDEKGWPIYKVEKYSTKITYDTGEPSVYTRSGGWFVQEDDLDEFLEEYKENIEVVEDYRTES